MYLLHNIHYATNSTVLISQFLASGYVRRQSVLAGLGKMCPWEIQPAGHLA